MLKQPSARGVRAMEVESTHVHVLADGRKLIDVTMRRQADAPTKQVCASTCATAARSLSRDTN